MCITIVKLYGATAKKFKFILIFKDWKRDASADFIHFTQHVLKFRFSPPWFFMSDCSMHWLGVFFFTFLTILFESDVCSSSFELLCNSMQFFFCCCFIFSYYTNAQNNFTFCTNTQVNDVQYYFSNFFCFTQVFMHVLYAACEYTKFHIKPHCTSSAEYGIQKLVAPIWKKKKTITKIQWQ